ncbi:MAG: type II secretion system major pseudopilin GspG [Alphaproteobacteria bacterium]|nr:type II secretion system major pseudopilin GspG [Alphaproteobacteria bacterium]
MVILVLLASVVGPRVLGYLGSSRAKTAKVQIEALAASLALYKLDNGSYPSASDGLQALVERPSGLSTWSGPYLKKNTVPPDPWGQSYNYRFPGQHGEFDIFSYGADKKEGGTGENADVVSW